MNFEEKNTYTCVVQFCTVYTKKSKEYTTNILLDCVLLRYLLRDEIITNLFSYKLPYGLHDPCSMYTVVVNSVCIF